MSFLDWVRNIVACRGAFPQKNFKRKRAAAQQILCATGAGRCVNVVLRALPAGLSNVADATKGGWSSVMDETGASVFRGGNPFVKQHAPIEGH